MGYKNLTPSKDNGVNDGIANIKQNKIFKQFQIVAMTTEEQEWMPTGDKDKAMEFFFFACNLLTAFKVQSKFNQKENQKSEAARERIKMGDINTTLTISVIPRDGNKDGGMVHMNFDSPNTSDMFSHMQLTNTQFQETEKKKNKIKDLGCQFLDQDIHVPALLTTALKSIKAIEKHKNIKGSIKTYLRVERGTRPRV